MGWDGIRINTSGGASALVLSHRPPGPVLPPEVVAKTSAKYLEAYERLTGGKL